MKQNEPLYHILFSYLRYRLKSIIAYTVFLLIFFVVYALYRLNLEAYLYAALLSLVALAAVVVYDFLKYYKKHALLRDALNNISVTLERLPEPGHLIERDYQDLLDTLYSDRKELVSQADSRHSEMVDYYTLWAHQIKTPISAMRLLLQSGVGAPFVPELEQELFKIEQYVEMVLQYLRLESMSSDLTLAEYPLEDLIRQAVKKYSVVFIHKKIALKLEKFSCRVLTDEKWLTFVIEQILSNAVKYARGGEISIYTEDKTLVIADDGIGIAEEDLPRIFEKGFTGYNGRANKKSTGIGLYLCKTIIDRLHHTIWIESKPEKGTKVYLNFDREHRRIE